MKGLAFNESMIKAWMAGNKTVTRRLMKPQPEFDSRCAGGNGGTGEWWIFGKNIGRFYRPPYLPGETVYIKETWMGTKDCLSYKASDPRQVIEFGYDSWKSPRIMPEWASRSHARIVSVRPERVQEITEEAAIKEGILGTWDADNKIWKGFYREGFRQLWESIYPGSWGRNDWAWRIELEKL